MRLALLTRETPPDHACMALAQWLIAHPALRTIAIYSPLPGEVDLSILLQQRPDLHWVYPRVRGESLTFHSGGNLLPGSFGILEPAEGSPEIAVCDIDAFICPGLAFDPRGGRLGRGRGFYDRVLANARNDALKIGVCFDSQIVPDTFAEAHDVHMDVVIY